MRYSLLGGTLAAFMIANSPSQATAATIALACKLKEPDSYSDYKQVDQIIIDTIKKLFTFRVAKTAGTSRPLAWSFYENWSGDGCSHMDFFENPTRGEISGAQLWTCAASGVETFLYNRERGTFVYSLSMALLSDKLRWECKE